MRYFLILLFFISNPALSIDLETAQKRAKSNKIWQSEEWLGLLFYEKRSDGYLSKVTSSDFFISANGYKSPSSEVSEALKAIYTKNIKLRCQFIARTDWLIQKLNIPDEYHISSECKDFNEWAKPEKTKSISLVFATGYFGNPASYYGHSLIKFDQQTAGQGLNDTVVNFGAETPENENPLIYITKGIFGGYQAQFTSGKLYEHETIYGQVELRDLWLYQLSLSAKKQLLLQKHLWELRGQSFQYFFSSENCAYFIARAIENASGKTIVRDHPSKSGWVIPINGFMELYEQGAISNISYIPSRSSQLLNELQQLSSSDKKTLTKLSYSEFANFELKILTSTVSEKLLQASISYATYMASADKDNKKYWKTVRKKLITHRFSLPPSGREARNTENTNQAESPPHLGDRPSKIAISSWFEDSLSGLTLTLRVANSDQLSKNQGRIPYSRLEMLKIEMDIDESSLDLRQLTLVDIKSPNISKTGLKGDGGYSWQLSAIIAPYDFSCESCLTASGTGGFGKTVDFGQSALYSYLIGKINTPYQNESQFSAGINLGYLSQSNDYIHPKFDVIYLKGIDNKRSENLIWKAEARYISPQNWDNRIKLEHHNETRLSFEFGYLF
ncbi:DUF4105 domain-containing protein [Oceanospirillum sanctuarii]|uniref:Lnb N-terminal periplasmic domain-containing protein n=1 Tax=Oceanospirillum sanctuarii TaxID=1434821 RepID=UPI000A3D632B|nr:DUF4105 domain-containing protein [Oceanospirillum sanctuarii]